MRTAAPASLCAALLLGACTDHNAGVLNPNSGMFGGFPVFETRIDVPTGVADHADSAVGDFDLDGNLDVVVVGLDGQLQLLLGNGNGTFQGVVANALGGAPIGIREGDVDGDGDLDLAVLRTAAQDVQILLNDGDGDFTPSGTLPVGADAVFLVMGDLDADGVQDLAVSRTVSPELRVFFGDGAGQFVEGGALRMPAGGRPLAMATGDANGDGVVDLVVADRLGDRVLIYAGGGAGAAQPLAVTPEIIDVNGGASAVSLGDLSGDGVPDIVVSLFDAQMLQVITSRAGGVVQGFAVDVSGGPSLSEVVDVTGDGVDDLVCCVQGRYSVSVFPGVPAGLGAEIQLDASGLPLRPEPGDVNNDGATDLLVLSGLGDRLNLFFGTGDGLNGAQSYEAGIPGPEAVDGADFDGDGINEIVVAGNASTEVTFMRRQFDPVLGRVALVPVHRVDLGSRPYNVVVADLNRDGRSDVLAAVEGGVKALENVSTAGQLAFAVRPPSGVLVPGTGPYWVEPGDMNGDGRPDLAIADFQGDRILVALATDDDFGFAAPLETPLPGAPAGLILADLDGDGALDVATARNEQARVTTLFNDGNGVLRMGANVPVGAGAATLRTADFNGDGRADLVVSNGRGGSITVLFPIGEAFVTTQEYPAGDSPSALLTRDLNGDGSTDILVAALVDGEFRVLLGDGDGGFPDVVTFPGTTNAVSGVLLDMDGDAREDLLLASLRTTRVTMVRNITPSILP